MASNEDVEMQGATNDASLNGDLTDPSPAPAVNATQDVQPPPAPVEHLSTIQPAAVASAAAASPAATTPVRPTSIPPPQAARPEKPAVHGGPTRQYLNQNITPYLLEGMKYLAMHEPEKPLAWLSDFLKERSREVEG